MLRVIPRLLPEGISGGETRVLGGRGFSEWMEFQESEAWNNPNNGETP